jgi:hypothetical protein
MQVFTLECGAQVQWDLENSFADYQIKVVRDPSHHAVGCGNPFNWMTDAEIKLVKEQRPKNNQKPCRVNSMMYSELFTSEDKVKTEMSEIIACDCWGVFTTTVSRDKVIRMYFDTRSQREEAEVGVTCENYEEEITREKLIRDSTELVQAMNDGLTVVIQMGHSRFVEHYFFKIHVANNVYLHITNVNYTDCD